MPNCRRLAAAVLPAALLLLLSGCVPDVRTDHPREYEYAASDEIRVYSIDDGSVLMTLTVTGARVMDDQPQTWVYEYADTSGETVRRETAIRQVVEITCRYAGPASSSAPAQETTCAPVATTDAAGEGPSAGTRPPESAIPDAGTSPTAPPDTPEKAGTVTLPVGWLAILLVGAGLAGGAAAALVLLLLRRR